MQGVTTELNSPRRILHVQKSLDNYQRLHIPLLLVLALLTRVGVLFHLNTVMLGWRQADLSSIAMNYLHNGFRFLYPQIDWGGDGPGYVEMEFPIIPFLTAVLFKVFGPHDACALVIPFVCGLGVVVAVYLLARKLYGSSVAVVAAAFVALSPLLSLASQTFLGEPALLLSTILSVYFLIRWAETNRMRDYLLAAMCTTLAILLKLTALYIGLPLLVVFIIKHGKRVATKGAFWIFGALALVPVCLWYYHAHTLYLEYGNTFGILSGGYNKFARADLLLSQDFYLLMAKRILLSVSTPIVFLLFLVGLFRRPPSAIAYTLHWWVAALVIYTFLIAEGNKDMIYYQLPWLPVLSIVGSVGLFSFLEEIGRWPIASSPGRRRIAFFGVSVLVALSIVGVMVRSAHVPITFLDAEARIRTQAEEVKAATPEGALIIVATSYGNEKTPLTIDTPPQMFYFSERRGWYLALAWLTPGVIDSLQKEGADYLVVFGGDIEALRSDTALYKQLTSTYPATLDHTDLLVLQMTRKRSS